MKLRSAFFIPIFLSSSLSAKSVENSSWLGQGWTWSSSGWEWDGWNLTAASNASNWMSAAVPDVNEYFDKIEASFAKFVDQMRSDYTELSSEVRVKVTKDLETLRELKERVKEAMEEGREAVSSYNWRQRLNETMTVFDDIKLEQSVDQSVNSLNMTVREWRAAWTQFSIAGLVSSYTNLTSESEAKELWASLKSLSTEMSSYSEAVSEAMTSLHRQDPVCQQRSLTCPDGMSQFTADTCCSSLWLRLGAPLGLGSECWTDLEQMLGQCSVFSCYGVDNGHFDISDGCSFVPDKLLNYESCVIHDLCYITPGVTKAVCDKVMEDNINTIYCNNVNRYESLLCSSRATVASQVLGWTDRYFAQAGIYRDDCHRSDSFLTILWKSTLGKYMGR